MRDGLRRHRRRRGLQAALVAIDPQTGNLLAMVGGSDFATTPFNRAVRSQPAAGLGVQAVRLCGGARAAACRRSRRSAACGRSRSQAPEGVWIPRDERASGQDAMTLREALLESNNAAAVLLQQQVGTRPVLRLAQRPRRRPNQPDVPSLALGSGLVTPLDLTAAYAVFPNARLPRAAARHRLGRRTRAASSVHQVHIERERDPVRAGRVPDGDDAAGRRRRAAPGAACAAQGVQRRRSAARPGTTNDYRDAWFVGFNSSVVVGVWVGFDQPQTIFEGGVGRARGAADLGRLHAAHRAASAGRRRSSRPTVCAANELCRVVVSPRARGVPDLHRVLQGRRRRPDAAVPDPRGQPEAAGRARRCKGSSARSARSIRGIFQVRRVPEVNRCWWCGTDPLYVEYHDRRVGEAGHRRSAAVREGLPRRLPGRSELAHDPPQARELPARVRGLRLDRVARFTARDVTRLLKDEGIVRHRGKIESTINNAKRAIELREECGSLAAYFWRWEPDPAIAARGGSRARR